MKFIFKIMIFLMCLSFGACAPEKYDGTSAESAKKSYEKMAKNLSPEKLKEFDEALKTFSEIAQLAHFTFEKSKEQVIAESREDFRKLVDGKTVEQIVKEKKAIDAELKKAFGQFYN